MIERVERPTVVVAGPHAGHDLARLTGRRPSGDMIGMLICLDCRLVVGDLAVCGALTRARRQAATSACAGR